ncbi:MAG: YIP1 family protein [Phycisphaerales bacterium]|nr:MAG: YIP1 family protein [Phycisphaerales bacterium]
MRCQNCYYLLFNLTRTDCPECGRPFAVTDYQFEPGAVEFLCPHCGQAYQGNDERGLPYPRTFICVSCDRAVDARQMTVRPVAPDAQGRVGSPWDERRHVGLWRAWWATFRMTLVAAPTFFRQHVGQSNVEAYWFAAMSACIGAVLSTAMSLGMVAILVIAQSGGAPGVLEWALMACVTLIWPLISPPIAGIIMGGCVHLVLVLSTPQRRSFGHTYRVILYGMGPQALAAIPLCGGHVAGIWSTVAIILGIREVHQTPGWLAAVAVLWLPAIVLLLMFAIFAIALAGSALG